jgi:hypothetical protein
MIKINNSTMFKIRISNFKDLMELSDLESDLQDCWYLAQFLCLFHSFFSKVVHSNKQTNIKFVKTDTVLLLIVMARTAAAVVHQNQSVWSCHRQSSIMTLLFHNQHVHVCVRFFGQFRQSWVRKLKIHM